MHPQPPPRKPFQGVADKSEAETLMKAGDIELLRHLTYYPAEIDKYWASIKIAMRHGYKFENVPIRFGMPYSSQTLE